MRRLTILEGIAMLGGLLLGAGVFAPWYEVVSPLAELAGRRGLGSYSGWEAHSILRWVLLVIAVAPFVLGYIVARDHQLTWARGELTAVLAIAAVGLLLYVGVIDRPGEPSGQIELDWSWYTAAGGALAIAVGGSMRASSTERRRKPPGVLK